MTRDVGPCVDARVECIYDLSVDAWIELSSKQAVRCKHSVKVVCREHPRGGTALRPVDVAQVVVDERRRERRVDEDGLKQGFVR
jgi:hypothetical protein